MRRKRLIVLGLVGVVLIAGTSDAQRLPPAVPSAREILARYIAARGGLDAILSVRTLVLTGEYREGNRKAEPAHMVRARPMYRLVGDSSATVDPEDVREGSDGAQWEFWGTPGILLRTTGAPATTSRHGAYFDDALTSAAHLPGWSVILLGMDSVDHRPAYRLRVKYPDGYQSEALIDKQTWLLVAERQALPIHAFGRDVDRETRIGEYRRIGSALFPSRFASYDRHSGQLLDEVTWSSMAANVNIPLSVFSPPPTNWTPLRRMLSAVYEARGVPSDALAWYLAFRRDPETANIDTEAGIEFVGYQCLKTGSVAAGIALLEANVRDYPRAASAHFGIGRAYNGGAPQSGRPARIPVCSGARPP